jgi:hypothetical protein
MLSDGSLWNAPEGDWYTVEEVADNLGIDDASVRGLVLQGFIRERREDGLLWVSGCLKRAEALPKLDDLSLSDLGKVLRVVELNLNARRPRQPRTAEIPDLEPPPAAPVAEPPPVEGFSFLKGIRRARERADEPDRAPSFSFLHGIML